MSNNEQTPFDTVLAATIVGKIILVGLTYLSYDGKLLRRQQLHGKIKSASPAGILIELAGASAGETWNMPPALDLIRKADPGIYSLKESGEQVENPDFICTWTITKPGPTN